MRPTTSLFGLFRRPCAIIRTFSPCPIHAVSSNTDGLTLQLPSFCSKRKQSREWGCAAFSSPSDNGRGMGKDSVTFWTRQVTILLQGFRQRSIYLCSVLCSCFSLNAGLGQAEWVGSMMETQFLHKVAFVTWDSNCYMCSPYQRGPTA